MSSTNAPSRNLGALLRERGLTIATAESCTGGALAAALTAVPGASDYFPGGVVTYSATLKAALLSVPAATIAAEGVVSEACALAMARGAREACGADLALATTGIAGPSGAEPNKPVGLVYIALAWEADAICRRFLYSGDRGTVIATATHDALTLALAYLHGRV